MFVLRLPPRAWLVLAFTLAFSVIGLRRATSQANDFITLSPQVNRPGQVFTVTNTNDSGPGSLRQALNDANTVPGTDTVIFSLGGNGLQRIALSAALPEVTGALMLDATPAAGAGPVPLVEVNGANAGENVDGLVVTAGNSTVQGLRLVGFNGNGLVLRTGGSNTVLGCLFQSNRNGILIENSTGNVIGNPFSGGQTQAGGNFIGGNREAGVKVAEVVSGLNRIDGNLIGVGLDANGNRVPLGNQGEGVLITDTRTVQLFNNRIINNISHGVRLLRTDNVNFFGNYIGTEGVTAAGNGGFGVLLTDAANTCFCPLSPAARNVISANAGGVVIENAASRGNRLTGNYIGTNAAGTGALGNSGDGIWIRNGATENQIGGSDPSDGNLIAGNLRYAVHLLNSANSNIIRNNTIGTNVATTSALPNGNTGVHINASSLNQVANNRLAFGNHSGFGVPFVTSPSDLTLAHGVAVVGGGTRNRISSNSIYANLGRAIFLDAANNNQAAPVITSALGSSTGDVLVRGTLDSTPNTDFTVEVFANQDCDEAETYLGTRQFRTNANGHAEFELGAFNPTVRPGQKVTATATDNNGNTSAISGCAVIFPRTLRVSSANDSGPGSLRQALLDANAQSGVQDISISLPAYTTINLLSPLPPITETLRMDAFGGPQAQPNSPPTLGPVIELDGVAAGTADGLVIQANNCFVRGFAFNRFSGSGVRVLGNNNEISMNYMGVDLEGVQARGNGIGLMLESGTTNYAELNLVSGNNGPGIVVNAPQSNVSRNNIGTDWRGLTALPNAGDGIVITAANAVIEDNYINGNNGAGLHLQGAGQTLNAGIARNFIGVAPPSQAALPNNGGGIIISNANGNLIGGILRDTDKNVIANNNGPGVTVGGGGSNRILGNQVYNNSGPGIVLINGGNNNAPSPNLDVVVTSGNFTSVQGVFQGASNAAYRLQFFAGAVCGAAQSYVGELNATTDATGSLLFRQTLAQAVPAGQFIVATATDANGNTSQFSACKQVVGNQSVPVPVGNNVLLNLGDVSVILSQVNTAGMLNLTPLSPFFAGALPQHYSLTNNSLAYELGTTANNGGPVVVCQNVPQVNDVFAFSRLRLLRNEGGNAIERTVLPPNDPAPNFAARRLCAQVANLGAGDSFVLASLATLNITGRVVNQSGVGAPGVIVGINNGSAQPATTDAEGRYLLTNLAGGNYTLTPMQAGGAFMPATQNLNITVDTVAPDFIVTPLPSTTNISGRITDNSGAGLSSVLVSLTGLGGVSTRTTNANGDYVFTGLVNGNYTATPSRLGYDFTPAQRAINSLNGDVTGVNFTGVFVPNPTPSPTPDDGFGDGEMNRERWNLGVSSLGPTNFDPRVIVTQGSVGGVLLIQPRSGVDGQSFSGYVSAIPLDLTQMPIIGVQAVAPATGTNAGTAFSVGRDSDNFARFLVTAAPQQITAQRAAPTEGGMTMLVLQANFNGTNNSVTLPYDPVQHLYWRFRYDAVSQTIYLETSPDATVWTVRLSRTLPPNGVQGLVAEIASGTFGSTINPGPAQFDNYNVSQPIGFQLSTNSYSRSESGGAVTITVVRTGTADNPASVNYATSDGTARAGEDYTPAGGTLVFGIGETSKTFAIPITGDTVLEADETVNITLSNPVGSRLNERAGAILTIIDDDSGANPIDGAEFFTRQQYRDFLGREPDPAGLNYWTGQITSCGSNLACVSRRRVEVSAAFFIELEFQNTGSFVSRMYRASFGRVPAFGEFTPDLSRLAGAANPVAARNAFAADWVRRSAFSARYDAMAANAYVDALFANAGVLPTPEERASLILGLATQTMSRTSVLLQVVDNAQFKQREYNRTFVLMQYFGYLQRDPDAGGFGFWLGVLNSQPANFRGMVCAFITSEEYQRRFSPIVTRNNGECQ